MNFYGWPGMEMIMMSGLWLPLMLWSLFWKALALWRAGRRNEPIWFTVLLLVNALGILEIIYLLIYPAEKRTRGSARTRKKAAA